MGYLAEVIGDFLRHLPHRRPGGLGTNSPRSRLTLYYERGASAPLFFFDQLPASLGTQTAQNPISLCE